MPNRDDADGGDRIPFFRCEVKTAITLRLVGALMLACLPVSAGAQDSGRLPALNDPAYSSNMLKGHLGMLRTELQEQRNVVANVAMICIPMRGPMNRWDDQNRATRGIACMSKNAYIEHLIKNTFDGNVPSQDKLQYFIRNVLGFSTEYKRQIREALIPVIEKDIAAYEAELSRRESWNSPSGGATGSITDGVDMSNIDIFSSSDDAPSGNTGAITGDIRSLSEPWDQSVASVQACPDPNPDRSSNHHIFDSNDNPDDRIYLDCTYFKTGHLRVQLPYKDGKYDGIYLSYINWPECGGVKLTSRQIYEDGDRVKLQTFLCNTANGMPYQQNETDYFNGKTSLVVQWHSTGAMSYETQYDGRGKPMKRSNYNKHGELISCTKWDGNGSPSRCK